MCEEIITELDYGKGIPKECLNMWQDVAKIQKMFLEAASLRYLREVLEEKDGN